MGKDYTDPMENIAKSITKMANKISNGGKRPDCPECGEKLWKSQKRKTFKCSNPKCSRKVVTKEELTLNKVSKKLGKDVFPTRF